jgi:hypothetical protein
MLRKKFVSLFCAVVLISSLNFNICYGEEAHKLPSWVEDHRNFEQLEKLWEAVSRGNAQVNGKDIYDAFILSANDQEFSNRVKKLPSGTARLLVKKHVPEFLQDDYKSSYFEEKTSWYSYTNEDWYSDWKSKWEESERDFQNKQNEWDQAQRERERKNRENLTKINSLVHEINAVYKQIFAEYQKNSLDNSINISLAAGKMDFLNTMIQLDDPDPKTWESALVELKELLKKSENNVKNPKKTTSWDYSNSWDTPKYSFYDYDNMEFSDNTPPPSPQEEKKRGEQISQDLKDNKKSKAGILIDMRNLSAEALVSVQDLTTIVEEKYNADEDKTPNMEEIYNIIQKANNSVAQKVEVVASSFIAQTIQKSFVNEVVMVNAGRSSGDESKEFGVWSQGFGGFAKQKKNNQSQAFDAANIGVALGCDFGSEHWKIGVSCAASNTKIKFSDYSDQDNIVANLLGSVYGSYTLGSVIQLSVNSGVGGSDITTTSKKKISRVFTFTNVDAKYFIKLNDRLDLIARVGGEAFVTMKKNREDKSYDGDESVLFPSNVAFGIRNRAVEFGKIKYNAEIYLGADMQKMLKNREFWIIIRKHIKILLIAMVTSLL